MTFMGQIILGKGEYCLSEMPKSIPTGVIQQKKQPKNISPWDYTDLSPPPWTTPQYMQNWTTLVIASLSMSHTGSILDLHVLFNNLENAFIQNGLVFLHVLYGAVITFYLVVYLLNNFAELLRSYTKGENEPISKQNLFTLLY